MSNLEWKDATRYLRGKVRNPTAWELVLSNEVKIWVSTGHIYNRNRWTMHCRPWFDTYDLGMDESVPAEEAQSKAMSLVRAEIDRLNAVLRGIN